MAPGNLTSKKEPTGRRPWACEELLTEPSPCCKEGPSLWTVANHKLFSEEKAEWNNAASAKPQAMRSSLAVS